MWLTVKLSQGLPNSKKVVGSWDGGHVVNFVLIKTNVLWGSVLWTNLYGGSRNSIACMARRSGEILWFRNKPFV